MTRSRALIVSLMLLLSMCPAATGAQATPAGDGGEPDPEAFTFAAAALGDGWVELSGESALTLIAGEGIVDQSAAVFGGPQGARVVIHALIVGESRADIVGVANRVEGWFLFYSFRGDANVDEVEGASPLVGCDDARRMEGLEGDVFPLGLTSCAVGLDIVLLAASSGEVLGELGDQASDAVIALMLETDQATTVTLNA